MFGQSTLVGRIELEREKLEATARQEARVAHQKLFLQ